MKTKTKSNLVPFPFRMNWEYYTRLKIIAEYNHVTMASLVNIAIGNFLKVKKIK